MVRLDLHNRWFVLACAGMLGCANDLDGPAPYAGTTSAGGSAATSTSGSSDPEPTESRAPLLAPRVRRLTNAEYDATVRALLGTEQALGAQFVPDARLHKYGKFARNEAQIVEPMLARQLAQAAAALASEYVTEKLDAVLTCSSTGDAACARVFFEEFLPKAYRRPATSSELDDLLSIVVVPSIERDGFRDAIALGIEAVLQSTAFLYHTELGPEEVQGAGIVTLTNAEIASELAYLLTGAPADAELASSADLDDADVREAQARRLLQTPAARAQVRRMVKQWLDIDRAGEIIKDELKYPNFSPSLFDTESDDFIDEVVFTRQGTFEMLLGADFTVGTAQLAEVYGAAAPPSEPGLIDLSGGPRRGILNRGAFLTSFTTPVKRGARFVTQVLCLDPGDPAMLNLRLTLPPPDAAKTRRQRFEEHSDNAVCAGCHNAIDSAGFTFEHFNELGEWEANEGGNPELPVDSSSTLMLPESIEFGAQSVADSAELASLASQSEAGRRCFARNLARFTAAAYGAALEQGFVDEWERLAVSGRDTVQNLLVAYVGADPFIWRDPNGEVGEP